MAITLTGTGGLFTRLGAVASALNNSNGALGSTAPSLASLWGAGGTNINALQTSMTKIEEQFASTNQQLIDSLFSNRDKLRTAAAGYKSYLKTLAEQILITMADDDVKLTSKTVLRAMTALYIQMNNAGDKFTTANTVSVSVANGVNGAPVGDGVAFASVVEPRKGLTMQYPSDEVIDLFCTTDKTQGATAGRELFRWSGDAAQTDSLAYDWPKGSGSSGTLNAISASEDAGSNLLTNSDFEDFAVANTPDKWTIGVGTAGTDIFSGTAYKGSLGLKYTGAAGAPLSTIRQTFDTSGQTTGKLKPNTVYAFNCWMKKSGAGLLAGTVQFSLVNSSNVVINDAAATANTITKDGTTLTTSFAAVNGFFRTPAQIVSGAKFQIAVSVALTSGESIFIDELTLSEAKQAYIGGPYFQICSGATDFVAGAGNITADSFAVTVANNWGSEWQKVMQRLFDMRSLLLQIPTTGAGTSVADSLIEAV